MFKFLRKTPNTPADQKIKQLQELLFPEPSEEVEGEFRFYVDSSVDTNLEGALIDLQEGHNDEVVHKTLRSIANKLFHARKIIQAYYELDSNIKYLVTDDGYRNVEIDH